MVTLLLAEPRWHFAVSACQVGAGGQVVLVVVQLQQIMWIAECPGEILSDLYRGTLKKCQKCCKALFYWHFSNDFWV